MLAAGLIAAIRRDLPAVCAARPETPFTGALAAMGLSRFGKSPAEVAVEIARENWPQADYVVESFSLTNALRAGLSMGGGSELLVHLATIAREAQVFGFEDTIRVVGRETPQVAGKESAWFREHGLEGLLAYLGEDIHDTSTVSGFLKESLPPAPPAPETTGGRLVFMRGRASGMEAVCRVPGDLPEVEGDCRVFDSEEEAARAVRDGEVDDSAFIVLRGCGPRGGPGLLRLVRLQEALEEAGLAGNVPVFTDGMEPEDAAGIWVSLTTPEASEDGVIGRLEDGDHLRMDFERRRIRANVKADDLDLRVPFVGEEPTGTAYAIRYAHSALPALEGAGFG